MTRNANKKNQVLFFLPVGMFIYRKRDTLHQTGTGNKKRNKNMTGANTGFPNRASAENRWRKV